MLPWLLGASAVALAGAVQAASKEGKHEALTKEELEVLASIAKKLNLDQPIAADGKAENSSETASVEKEVLAQANDDEQAKPEVKTEEKEQAASEVKVECKEQKNVEHQQTAQEQTTQSQACENGAKDMLKALPEVLIASVVSQLISTLERNAQIKAQEEKAQAQANANKDEIAGISKADLREIGAVIGSGFIDEVLKTLKQMNVEQASCNCSSAKAENASCQSPSFASVGPMVASNILSALNQVINNDKTNKS